MWIMVSGPYTTGAADEAARAANLRRLNEAALALWRRGQVPVIGVNAALPMVEAADDPAVFGALMLPVSLALSERCDACLRIGGPSEGADEEAARFRAAGKPVFARLEDVP